MMIEVICGDFLGMKCVRGPLELDYSDEIAYVKGRKKRPC
jgi:hypothetical protein